MALSKEEMEVRHPDLNALAAFIDGRLSDDERAALLVHMAGCAECRATLAAHARGQTPALVHSTERAGPRSRSRFRRPAVWLPVAATVALAGTAGLLMLRLDRASTQPPAVPVTSEPGPRQAKPPAPTVPRPEEPPQAPSPSSTAAPPASQATTEPLTVRRDGVRIVNGKTFRMVAGEWIDSAYDPVALLPVQDIAGPEARAALLDRIPALAPYAALGPRITVTHEDVVYRFRQ